jgi:hypothetical protein
MKIYYSDCFPNEQQYHLQNTEHNTFAVSLLSYECSLCGPDWASVSMYLKTDLSECLCSIDRLDFHHSGVFTLPYPVYVKQSHAVFASAFGYHAT